MSLSHIKSFILTCKEGYFSFIQRIIVIWKMELPWLESSTTTSTPAYSHTTYWKMELPWLESSTTTSTPAYSHTITVLEDGVALAGVQHHHVHPSLQSHNNCTERWSCPGWIPAPPRPPQPTVIQQLYWEMELPWLESSTTTSTPAYGHTTTVLKTSQKKQCWGSGSACFWASRIRIH